MVVLESQGRQLDENPELLAELLVSVDKLMSILLACRQLLSGVCPGNKHPLLLPN